MNTNYKCKWFAIRTASKKLTTNRLWELWPECSLAILPSLPPEYGSEPQEEGARRQTLRQTVPNINRQFRSDLKGMLLRREMRDERGSRNSVYRVTDNIGLSRMQIATARIHSQAPNLASRRLPGRQSEAVVQQLRQRGYGKRLVEQRYKRRRRWWWWRRRRWWTKHGRI